MINYHRKNYHIVIRSCDLIFVNNHISRIWVHLIHWKCSCDFVASWTQSYVLFLCFLTTMNGPRLEVFSQLGLSCIPVIPFAGPSTNIRSFTSYSVISSSGRFKPFLYAFRCACSRTFVHHRFAFRVLAKNYLTLAISSWLSLVSKLLEITSEK